MAEEKMIEGQDANKKKSNWLPFLVVVIAAVVLIFASGGDKTSEEDGTKNGTEGTATEEGETTEGDATTEEESAVMASEIVAGMDQVTVASDFTSWAPEGRVDEDLTVSRTVDVEGDIEKAYIGVTASVGGRALNEFESVYFKLGFDGGHLFRPDSLTSSSETATSMLFDLSELPYLPGQPYDESRESQTADLTSLLEEGDRPLVYAFISTLEEATIDDLTIYYACADGSDCSVSVE